MKSFDKVYGFIAEDAGGEMFVHIADVRGRRELKRGDRVSYSVAPFRGRPKAVNVEVAPAAEPRRAAPPRSPVKPGAREAGSVDSFNASFGFIKPVDGGRYVFFHRDDLRDDLHAARGLEPDDFVSFRWGVDVAGRPKAVDVALL